MNDPNYNDWADFYGEKNGDKSKYEKFVEKIFNENENRPAVIRNPGCKFTEAVLAYLDYEWELNVIEMTIDIQTAVMDFIDEMKAANRNVVNTAGDIALKIIPL